MKILEGVISERTSKTDRNEAMEATLTKRQMFQDRMCLRGIKNRYECRLFLVGELFFAMAAFPTVYFF